MPHDERCRDLAAYFLTDGHELAPATQDDVYSMAEAIQQAIEEWFAAARIRALAAPPAGPEVTPEPFDEHDGTTLINELMMSADMWARVANENVPGLTPEAGQRLCEERYARATRIRARAEHVRAILGAVNETAALSFAKRDSVEEARLLNRLCGPLAPAGTGGRR